MNRQFPLSDWERQHYAELEAYAAQVQNLYQTAVADIVRLHGSLPVDFTKPFKFADYPQASERLRTILETLSSNLVVLIGRGTTQAWGTANTKAEAFLLHLVEEQLISLQAAGTLSGARNEAALLAFQQRKTSGLTISQRVFQYTGQYKGEMETALSTAVQSGTSAARLAMKLNSYLVNPAQLAIDAGKIDDPAYRRKLLRQIDNNHPGRGVYKSSYANADRLARTEINAAYRESDLLRYRAMPFVVGIEVRRSNRGGTCDVCESLKGRYPKDFQFVGWHSNCRCYTVPVLVTEAEFEAINEAILAGEELRDFESVNEIKAINPGYVRWVDDNRDRLLKAKTLPLFISDNRSRVEALAFLSQRR